MLPFGRLWVRLLNPETDCTDRRFAWFFELSSGRLWRFALKLAATASLHVIFNMLGTVICCEYIKKAVVNRREGMVLSHGG
jgi:hypothetical protein